MPEHALIDPPALHDRRWYRHVIYAPGLYTGYGVKTIPGVREAVDAGNYARAAEQAKLVVRALERATRTLQLAAAPSRVALDHQRIARQKRRRRARNSFRPDAPRDVAFERRRVHVS